MKKVSLFIVGLLMLGFFSAGLAAEMKVAVLDLNKVLAELPQVKNMQRNLKNRFGKREQDILKLRNDFDKNLGIYKENNTKLQGDKLKQEQQKLFDANKKLLEESANFQRDLVVARDEALGPILQQIGSVSARIAKEQKFNLIVTKTSTIYSDPQLEITDSVIAEMGKLVSANKDKVDSAKSKTKPAETAE